MELHGAHGYLLTNFFSPTTNHRTDMYGGTLENRARIHLEILEDVRRKVGADYPVTVRLSGTDYEPDGLGIENTIYLAKELEKRGISSIDVSHHGLRLHHAAGIRRGHHPKRQGRLCSAGPPL